MSSGVVKRIFLIQLVVLFFAGAAAAPGIGTIFTVLDIDGAEYVELNALAAEMGWSKSWDNIGRRLVCRGPGETVEFTIDSPYLVSEEEIYNIHYPVRMIRGRCYVPVSGVLDWAANTRKKTLRWSSERGRFYSSGKDGAASLIEGISIRRIDRTVQLRLTLLENTTYEFDDRGEVIILRFPEAGSLPGTCLLPDAIPPLRNISATCTNGVSTEIIIEVRGGIDPPKLAETLNPRGLLLIFNYKRPTNVWDVLPMTGITPLKERIARREKFRTVVLDPGHGGADPGCIGATGTLEKYVTLQIALKTADILRRNYGLRVLLTRKNDRYIPLDQRCEFANMRQGDLFVSIHANSSVDPSLKGVQAFYFRDTDNAEEDGVLAEKRLGHLSSTYGLPISMTQIQKKHIMASFEAASCISYMMGKTLEMHNLGVHDEAFYVLRGAAMPAVLVETGFLSSPEEEALLKNPVSRRRIARAIADGVRIYMNL